MKLKKYSIYLCAALGSLILITSCSYFNQNGKKENDITLAKVHNKELFLSDLSGIVNSSLSSQDSVKLIRNYIDGWVRKNLMLRKAEQYLPKQKINIEKQVQDYRESLLIYTYEKELVRNKADTIVTNQEIQSYYETFQSNFTLRYDVLKATYVVVSNDSPQKKSIRSWLRSKDDTVLENLQEYCYQNAKLFALAPEWHPVDDFLNKLPGLKNDSDFNRLEKGGFYQTNDETQTYFVRVFDYAKNKQIAPLDYVRQDVVEILVNKKKVKFIKELNNRIYKEGFSQEVTLYQD